MVGSNSGKLESTGIDQIACLYLMGQDLDEWEVGYEVSMIKHEEASGKI